MSRSSQKHEEAPAGAFRGVINKAVVTRPRGLLGSQPPAKQGDSRATRAVKGPRVAGPTPTPPHPACAGPRVQAKDRDRLVRASP